MSFEQKKKEKLERLPLARLMNLLGVLSWQETEYKDAEPFIRLIHPLSWVWIVAVFISGIIMQGIPESIKDMKACIDSETVWW